MPYRDRSTMRSRWRAAARAVSSDRCSRADDGLPRDFALGARAVPRPPADRESRLRQGIHRPRLAAAAPRAWRSRSRRRRRGDGRHPRRHCITCSARRCRAVRDVIAAITGRWMRGAARSGPGVHPFRKPSTTARRRHAQLGRARSHARGHRAFRGVFAAITFYAHMDEEAARAQSAVRRPRRARLFPDLGGRGLVRRSAVRPVLANYGLDHLRFMKPVKPGDRIKVRLTCKEKIAAHRARAMARCAGTRRSPTRTARSSRATTC